MQKWEYRLEVIGTDEPKKFNVLGDEGWELVAAETTDPEMNGVFNCFFKRPKQ